MFDVYSFIVPLAVLAGVMLLTINRWDGYQIEIASPDTLRFDLESGDLISAGHRVSRLLGYPHSGQCLGQYNAHVHLVNCGLGQLASGRMMTNALKLQDRNGLPLPQALRIRLDHKGRFLELAITDQSERRRLEQGSEVNFPQIKWGQPEAEAHAKHLSALLTLLEAQHETEDGRYYAVHDRATGRLFVTRSLLARMGLAARDRWIPEQLWSQCLLGSNWTSSSDARIDLGECGPQISVVTMRGEDLLFDLAALPFDDLFLLNGALSLYESSPAASLEKNLLNESAAETDTSVRAAPLFVPTTDSQVVAEHRYQCLRLALGEPIVPSRIDELELSGSPAVPNAARLENLTLSSKGHSDFLTDADDYSQLKLLLVEDDDLIRQAIRPALEKLGATFAMAKTLSDALGRLSKEGPFDVVLTDLNLGAETSRPLIERVRRESPRTIVLLMTASPVALLGVHQRIAKPYDMHHLRMTVEWGLMRSKIERRHQEAIQV